MAWFAKSRATHQVIKKAITKVGNGNQKRGGIRFAWNVSAKARQLALDPLNNVTGSVGARSFFKALSLPWKAGALAVGAMTLGGGRRRHGAYGLMHPGMLGMYGGYGMGGGYGAYGMHGGYNQHHRLMASPYGI